MRTINALMILLMLGSSVLPAQDSTLQFEVASVRSSDPTPKGARPGRSGQGGPGTNDPERLTYSHVLFRQLLMDAYGIQGDQIKGPDWAIADIPGGGALFDISAKIPPGATREQVAVMLQNLLRERFQLVVHHATNGPSGLSLVPAKGGPKLKDSAGPPRQSEQGTIGARGQVATQTEADGFPQLFPESNMGGSFNNGKVRMRFRDYGMPDLVHQLSFMLSVRISDDTGLSGKYDFKLEFVVPEDAVKVGMFATMPAAPNRPVRLSSKGPDPGQMDSAAGISSAMEKQLGLKLQGSKGTGEMLVIDHAEKKPTEN